MITLKNGYLLHKIGGIPYLLPYGQNIADFRHSIRLNESGLLLYHTLEQGADEDALLAALTEHYQAKDSEIPTLRKDMQRFLEQLESVGILSRTNKFSRLAPAPFSFRIGPAAIAYYGPKNLLAPSLFDFSCENGTPDLTFRVVSAAPSAHETGEILVRTDELTICKNENLYLLIYPAKYGIREAHISLDGKQADFFCPMPYDGELTEKLFHAFRFAYLIRVQKMGAFAIHSSSILYQGKAWLFSGPSGAGKSTHTALWNRLYQTPYINGDLNLLGFSEGSPVVYGIPWCGTSGLYTTKTVPLGGIIFLKQALSDTLLPLTTEEASIRVMQRLVSPTWTADMLLSNLAFMEKLNRSVLFFHLHCTKEDSAAVVMKQGIDEKIL